MTSLRTDTKSLQELLFLLTMSDVTKGEQLAKSRGFAKAFGVLQRHQTHFPLLSSRPPDPHGL